MFKSVLCPAHEKSKLATEFANGDWPRIVLQREVWPLPKALMPHDIHSVVYGFKELGYFEIVPLVEGRQLSTEIFPPGYRTPIEYLLTFKDGRKPLKLGERQYLSPFKKFLQQPRSRAWGNLSLPFILTSWSYAHDQQIPVVFNALGEIVWALRYTSPLGEMVGPVIKKISSTEYLVMSQHQVSTLAVVNAKSGTVVREYHSKNLFFHHDFQYLPETEEVAALAHDCRVLPWYQEFSPVFSGLRGLINIFGLPRRSYDGSQLVRINLITGKTRSVWSVFDSFSVAKNPNMAIAHNMDASLDIRYPAQYLELLQHPVLTKKNDGLDCTMDWTHVNSVRHYPGKGFLISLRNLNKIVMISEKGELVWSLGNDPDNTYPIHQAKARMGLQHDAWLIGEDKVLIFDNASAYRGELPRLHVNRIMLYNMTDRGAEVAWEKQLPLPSNVIRGSVDPLNNGNIFVHMSSTSKPIPNRYVEINMKSNKIVGITALWTNTFIHPVAARPLSAIADEKFIGGARPNAHTYTHRAVTALDDLPSQLRTGRENY